MIKKGFVYRGKIAKDVLVYVRDISEDTNTVVGVVNIGMGMNGVAPLAVISYRQDTFLNYYEETDIVYTHVTFKVSDGEVVAFLWDVDANTGNVMSYMHFGQHGEASHEFYFSVPHATYAQYKDLYEELESLGYMLDTNSEYQQGVDDAMAYEYGSSPMPKKFKDGYI